MYMYYILYLFFTLLFLSFPCCYIYISLDINKIFLIEKSTRVIAQLYYIESVMAEKSTLKESIFYAELWDKDLKEQEKKKKTVEVSLAYIQHAYNVNKNFM